MKLRIFTVLLSLLGSLYFATQSSADDLSAEKGYVDFGNLSGSYGEPKVQINLGSGVLNFFGKATHASDPETSALFSKLKSIRVYVFDLKEGSDAALATVADVSKQIQGQGWETLVSVNEGNEQVRIFSKLTDGVIDGLVVMAVDGATNVKGQVPEAVFINIIGSLEPEQLGKVTASFGLDLGQ